jgi:hypothetical protein
MRSRTQCCSHTHVANTAGSFMLQGGKLVLASPTALLGCWGDAGARRRLAEGIAMTTTFGEEEERVCRVKQQRVPLQSSTAALAPASSAPPPAQAAAVASTLARTHAA